MAEQSTAATTIAKLNKKKYYGEDPTILALVDKVNELVDKVNA